MRILMCGDKLPRDEKSLKAQGRIIRMLEGQKIVCPHCNSTLSWNANDVHLTDDYEKQFIYCPFDHEQIFVDMGDRGKMD